MPEHIRALTVVLVLSGLCWLLLRPSLQQWASEATVRQWSYLWGSLTLVSFLSHSFWVYLAFCSVVFITRKLRAVEALAIFCLLLFVVPAAGANVPGLGLINYIFTLNQIRLLAILVLLPAAWTIANQPNTPKLGKVWPDRFFIFYLVLAAVLQFRDSNLTSALRGIFYLGIDNFLPYYVASRSLSKHADFKLVFSAFVFSASILATMAVFETARHWNLYSAMVDALGLHWGLQGYLTREGIQRASGSVGQAIVLGYVMAIGTGLWLYLVTLTSGRLRHLLPGIIMSGGMIASLSRGPWLGAAIILVVFVSTGKNSFKRLTVLLALFFVSLFILNFFAVGQKLISFLPFIGSVDDGSQSYRSDLFINAMIVIERNFWLGSTDYLNTPEMMRMIQGQGIIDIVNSYLAVALDSGMLGLFLFTSIFLAAGLRVWARLRTLPYQDQNRLLGQSLLATLIGSMLIIATVSSIVVIPTIYWALAGMCTAYGYFSSTPSKT